ncbi:MAG: MerR family transcriptional regulator [Planctomycetes bacterium]|nr:MerR family transcriptional regulator [Planctomycetota bacterium]
MTAQNVKPSWIGRRRLAKRLGACAATLRNWERRGALAVHFGRRGKALYDEVTLPALREPCATVREVAKMCGRSERTLRRWIKRGILRAWRPNPESGRYYIPITEARRLAAETGRAFWREEGDE